MRQFFRVGPAGAFAYPLLQQTGRGVFVVIKFMFLACIGAATAFVQPVFADTVSEGVSVMPGSVQDVRFAGSWQSNGRNGAYRIVVTRDGGAATAARLFVQWIAYGEPGGPTVAASIEINEIADLGLNIVDNAAKADAEGLAVYFEVFDPGSSGNEEYELFVFAPNEYRFDTATN